MSMLETAEVVAGRYAIDREAQDEYAVQSQTRTAQAQIDGRFDDEIVPLASIMKLTDKETGQVSEIPVNLEKDEGNRPGTDIAGLTGLKPVFANGMVIDQGRAITAGNASQLSDGASASLLMEAGEASRRNVQPMGIYRGMAVAGCDPDEMGIGPVYAVPKLLKANNLSIDDIDLWELNEAFAVQVIYCRDRLGIPDDRLNVDGGAISIGHPYGMSGGPVGRPRINRRQTGATPNMSCARCVSAAEWARQASSKWSDRSTAALRPFRPNRGSRCSDAEPVVRRWPGSAARRRLRRCRARPFRESIVASGYARFCCP